MPLLRIVGTVDVGGGASKRTARLCMSNDTGPSNHPPKAGDATERPLDSGRTWLLIWSVGIGTLITPVTLILALYSTGGGGGDYRLFGYFYPCLMLLMKYQFVHDMQTIIFWGLLQFPIYGLVIGLSKGRSRAVLAAGLLLTLHLAAVCFCFWDAWWR
jgi:hypothetical protein